MRENYDWRIGRNSIKGLRLRGHDMLIGFSFLNVFMYFYSVKLITELLTSESFREIWRALLSAAHNSISWKV